MSNNSEKQEFMEACKFTPEVIEFLPENSIFCFGSNMNGDHAGGAARIAVEKFGAIPGQAKGLQGQSYAIPTLGKKMQKLSLSTIEKSVKDFAEFARGNHEKVFYMTKIGCGIAGYSVEEIAEIFRPIVFTDNVFLPKEFSITVIAGFKGFNKNLQCTPSGKPFQYEIGKSYEEMNADLCVRGFHFCESPLSVLNYYPLKDGNRYAKVEGVYVSEQSEGDTKRVARKITIKAELSLGDLIRSSVEWVMDKIKESKKVTATSGDYSNSATSGDYSNSATSGDSAHSATSGKYSNSATSGDYSNSATSGDSAHSATSGKYSNSATSGYAAHSATSGKYSHSATSGKYSNSATSGDSAHSATSGNYSHSATSGKYSNSATSGHSAHSAVKDTAVAASVGINGNVKGGIGCWIVAAEWIQKGTEWEIAGVRSAKVDGEIIKEDTYYKLENGEFVECD